MKTPMTKMMIIRVGAKAAVRVKAVVRVKAAGQVRDGERAEVLRNRACKES